MVKIDFLRAKIVLLPLLISGIFKIIMQMVVKAYSIIGIGGML